MKLITTIAATLVIATNAHADSRIARLCGDEHINDQASADDVRANPDGFYVSSLQEQVSHGDPRIILTNNVGFHLCTTEAAQPGMPANEVGRLQGARKVKYLFVPICKWKQRPSS